MSKPYVAGGASHMLTATSEGREMYLRRIAPAFVLTALLTLALGAGGALGFASFGTKVKIDEGGPRGASGHVSSSQHKCLRGRRVTLFVEDEATGELDRIGSATTDGEGDWEVEEDLFAGDYVAKVAGKLIFLHGMRHTCRGGRSLTKHL
jgi:hypothetical protein